MATGFQVDLVLFLVCGIFNLTFSLTFLANEIFLGLHSENTVFGEVACTHEEIKSS